MYSRLLKAPQNKSFFLFGPRGVGKTTWVKKTFPEAPYLDLLEAEPFNNLLANPQRLENYIPKGYSGFVIIDEVQKVPELLDEIHRLIENTNYKFALIGSSARKLRKGGYNLLAGRALTYYLHPLSAIEMGKHFNLNHALKFGLLPSVPQEKDPKKYLQSYVKTYLEQEILQEGLTRNLSGFARFLETASFSQGSVLNVSEVARDAAVERKVVENYFNILEDLLIAIRIPSFSKKAKRRLTARTKFYLFDTGIFRAIRPAGPLDEPEMIDGAALETLFLQNLIALNSSLDLGYKIYFYQTATGAEVDFIAYGTKGIYAFEIKRTKRISSHMLSGLKKFAKDYPKAKLFFIYGGDKKMREGNIEIMPLEHTLKHLDTIIS